jgi:hypothetical protein
MLMVMWTCSLEAAPLQAPLLRAKQRAAARAAAVRAAAAQRQALRSEEKTAEGWVRRAARLALTAAAAAAAAGLVLGLLCLAVMRSATTHGALPVGWLAAGRDNRDDAQGDAGDESGVGEGCGSSGSGGAGVGGGGRGGGWRGRAARWVDGPARRAAAERSTAEEKQSLKQHMQERESARSVVSHCLLLHRAVALPDTVGSELSRATAD